MKKVLSILFIAIILMNSGQQVYANSKFDEEFFNLNNILYYDATETCVEGSSGPLIGNDNAEKIWNYLKKKGFTDEAAAGILGNAQQESSINPKRYEADYVEKIANLHNKMKNEPTVEALGMTWGQWQGEIYPSLSLNKDGYFHSGKHYIGMGFLQWTGVRTYKISEKAKSMNADIWDLGFQLDYLTEYEEGHASWVSSEYKNFKGSPEDAAKLFLDKWIVNSLKERAVYARQFYDMFKGKENIPTGSSTDNTDPSLTSSYTFIGDSITVGVKSQLESIFSGSNVKAEIGQGVAWAISQVASDIKDNIVINIGTNDKFTNGKDLLEKLKDKKVYLVNVYGAGGNADFETTNKNISNAMSGYSNVKLLDWKSYVDQNGGRDKFYAQEAGGANYHLNNEGNSLYIKFLQENLGSSQNSSSNICGGSDGKFYTSSEATRQTPDGFSIFSQCDSRWANDAGFGGRNICDTACGPFSLIMAVTALTGKADISSIINKSKPFSISGGGTSWDVASVVHDYGLKTHRVSNNEAEINKILNSGGMVMIAGQGPRPFISSGGHFVLVRKKTASGKWLIANPGGADQTYIDDDMKEWDPSFILQYTNIGDAVAITK